MIYSGQNAARTNVVLGIGFYSRLVFRFVREKC